MGRVGRKETQGGDMASRGRNFFFFLCGIKRTRISSELGTGNSKDDALSGQ